MAPTMQAAPQPIKMMQLQSTSRGSSIRRPETTSGSSMYSHGNCCFLFLLLKKIEKFS